jgi:hypothetical protein
MKEHTMEVLEVAEKYLVACIEYETTIDLDPIAAEHISCFVKGLKSISTIKYYQWLKNQPIQHDTTSRIQRS